MTSTFYEEISEQLRNQLNDATSRIREQNEQLYAEQRRLSLAEADRDAWKDLALKYGTMTDAEKRNEVGVLYGRVAISREVAMYGRGDAIAFACGDLATKMRRAFPASPHQAVPDGAA